jgi:hypothetical protein
MLYGVLCGAVLTSRVPLAEEIALSEYDDVISEFQENSHRVADMPQGVHKVCLI